MRNWKKIRKILIVSGLSLVCETAPFPVLAAPQESMSSVREEAQILPMKDGSGKYMMKSDGFYCLDVNGAGSATAEIHYFENFEINGTVFNGYYYHDADGKFKACSSYLQYFKDIPVYQAQSAGESETEKQAETWNGYYFINNLGKLSAAPQVRYVDNLSINGITLDGYFYFDQNGQMDTQAQIHQVEMNCYQQSFDGSYYFGGPNGALLQESTVTEDGFITDETGKVVNLNELGIENLKEPLETLLAEYQGTWSVFVKDLKADKEVKINDRKLYSASLIKVFVMARTCEYMDEILQNEAKKLNTSDMKTVQVKVNDLLWNMITVSDNESFNELVKLQTDTLSFKDGAKKMNEYLKEEGYTETSVQHTLHPAASAQETLGGRNMTSVRDCGKLLEKIYKGTCGSKEDSQAMQNLLENQEVTWKIPQGVPEGIQTANKTGETDESQHDIAIIYGEQTDYILCVMSQDCPENTAIENIRKVSEIVYNYLNLKEAAAEGRND